MSTNKAWTYEEVETAKRLKSNGFKNHEIGLILGRSKNAVETCLSRSKPKIERNQKVDSWSEADVAELHRLESLGMKVKEIAAAMGRKFGDVAMRHKKRVFKHPKQRQKRLEEKMASSDYFNEELDAPIGSWADFVPKIIYTKKTQKPEVVAHETTRLDCDYNMPLPPLHPISAAILGIDTPAHRAIYAKTLESRAV